MSTVVSTLLSKFTVVLSHIFTARKSIFSPVRVVVLLLLFVSLQIYLFLPYETRSGITSDGEKQVVFISDDEKYYGTYGAMFKHADAFSSFESLKLKDRCSRYFNAFQDSISDKLVDKKTIEQIGGDKDWNSFVTKEDFIQSNSQQNENKEELEKQFEGIKKINEQITDKTLDVMSAIRIFGKCFIEDTLEESPASDELNCGGYESSLFPWLTGLYPNYHRWNGDSSSGNLPAVSSSADENTPFEEELDLINKYGKNFGGQLKIKRSSPSCFLSQMRNDASGKGIVVYATNYDVDNLIRLGNVLRGLKNTLPIEIIHRNSISIKNQKRIIKSMRQPAHGFKPSAFPRQEVWFVNIKNSLKDYFEVNWNLKGRRFMAPSFSNSSGKVLAALLNSFEEMVLIDIDTIPLISPLELLQLNEYSTNGVLLFHDKQLTQQVAKGHTEYLKHLLPTKLDSHFFNIPLVNSATISKTILSEHYKNSAMDDGIVLMNRKQHFTGLLTALSLNVLNETPRNINSGKDILSLGLLISGDTHIKYNDVNAAAIGELTKVGRSKFVNSASRELCSSHTGQLDSKDRLLYIKSGFQVCDKPESAIMDHSKNLFRFFNEEELKAYYESSLQITAAIVPPVQEMAHSELDTPLKGWDNADNYCEGRLVCAYNMVGEKFKGKLVEFSSKSFAKYRYLASLWTYPIDV